MGYRQSDLQPAFDGAGTHPFRIWCYGTTDPLDEVLGPGYMRSGGSILSPGDLIYVRSCPRRDGRSWREADETRIALLMVVGWERNAMRLRLVQDFGRPEDGPCQRAQARCVRWRALPTVAAPALAQAPGRPAGSRNGRRLRRRRPRRPPRLLPEPSAPAPAAPASAAAAPARSRTEKPPSRGSAPASGERRRSGGRALRARARR